MIATVTTKGQVTIPKAIRDQMGIRPNDKVDFILEDGRVVLRTLKPLRELRGSVPAVAGASIDSERQSYRKRKPRKGPE